MCESSSINNLPPSQTLKTEDIGASDFMHSYNLYNPSHIETNIAFSHHEHKLSINGEAEAGTSWGTMKPTRKNHTQMWSSTTQLREQCWTAITWRPFPPFPQVTEVMYRPCIKTSEVKEIVIFAVLTNFSVLCSVYITICTLNSCLGFSVLVGFFKVNPNKMLPIILVYWNKEISHRKRANPRGAINPLDDIFTSQSILSE